MYISEVQLELMNNGDHILYHLAVEHYRIYDIGIYSVIITKCQEQEELPSKRLKKLFHNILPFEESNLKMAWTMKRVYGVGLNNKDTVRKCLNIANYQPNHKTTLFII